MKDRIQTHKKVFISYSWDNVEHQQWVLKLASDLIENFGVDVILDQYELSPGKDLPYFMESSIEKSDKVLIVLTPNYKTKAENRNSGVGFETSMISQEVFESPITNVKFIPVLRIGNHNSSSPKFLKSKISHDMSDDTKYDYQLFLLAKTIHNNALITKPKLGQIPNFEQIDADPIIDIANTLKQKEELNIEINRLLESSKGYEIFENQILDLKKLIKDKITLYSSKTDLNFKYEENNNSFIIYNSGYSVSFYWEDRYHSANKNILLMKFWTGYLRLNENQGYYLPSEQPVSNKIVEYNFDLNSKKEPVWKNKKSIATNIDITQEMFTYFIEKIRENKTKNFRNY